MVDREKVLHGLSSCGNDYGIPNICEVTECPYRGTGASCVHNLAHDASMLISELLKAQVANSACTKERCPVNASAISDDCNIETCPWRTEALIPRPSMSGLWYECPACGRHLTKDLDNYCARCGRRVKWG